MAAWRTGIEGTKTTVVLRGAIAECINAQARHRGLQQVPVFGLARARAIALWRARAHDLRIAPTLHPHVARGASA